MSQKEIERRKAIEMMEKNQEQIAALREALRTEAEQVAVFKQKWKKVILEMETDGAVVNDKQRQITKLTKEMELAQTKVS